MPRVAAGIILYEWVRQGELSPAAFDSPFLSKGGWCAIIRSKKGLQSVERVWCWVLTADFFWRVFEATGSVIAYLLYRQLLTQ